MAFDYMGARQAGYSDQEINDYLKQNGHDFDVAGARGAGYSDQEIHNYINQDSQENRDASLGIDSPVEKFLSPVLRVTRKIGKEKINPVLKTPVPEPIAKISQAADAFMNAAPIKETAGAFMKGYISGDVGAETPMPEPETLVGKIAKGTGVATGIFNPESIPNKTIAALGKTKSIAQVTKKIGGVVKGVAEKAGNKMMNVFLNSPFGEKVIKYVPDIFKAKNLDDAAEMIEKSRSALGAEYAKLDAQVSTTEVKKQVIDRLISYRDKFTNVNPEKMKSVDKIIEVVNQWPETMNLKDVNDMKVGFQALGKAAYKTGKEATSVANKTVADILRPFIEKEGGNLGTDVREINAAYYALGEAAVSASKKAEKLAVKGIRWSDMAPVVGGSVFGPQGAIAGTGSVIVNRLAQSPNFQKGLSKTLKSVSEKTASETEKSVINGLIKLGLLGGKEVLNQ